VKDFARPGAPRVMSVFAPRDMCVVAALPGAERPIVLGAAKGSHAGAACGDADVCLHHSNCSSGISACRHEGSSSADEDAREPALVTTASMRSQAPTELREAKTSRSASPLWSDLASERGEDGEMAPDCAKKAGVGSTDACTPAASARARGAAQAHDAACLSRAAVLAAAMEVDELLGQCLHVEWRALAHASGAGADAAGTRAGGWLGTLSAAVISPIAVPPTCTATETAGESATWRARSRLAELARKHLLGGILSERACSEAGASRLGGVLGSGGAAPDPNRPEMWLAQAERLQRAAPVVPLPRGERVRVPLLVATDAVHGHNNCAGATIFPHQIGLGCARRAEALVYDVARATAREVAATGVNMVYAPCLAVAVDARWGRTFESYAGDTQCVTALGTAAVRGLRDGSRDSVLVCVKHFVGDGATAAGSGVGGGLDQGDCPLPDEAIRTRHLPPYAAAVRAGALAVMASFSSVRGQRMHAHAHWLTDVLKGELNFSGFVVSDYDAVDGLVPGDWGASFAQAVCAGVDVVMTSGGAACGNLSYREQLALAREAVDSGALPEARLRDAARRVLYAKLKVGLLATKAPAAAAAVAASGGDRGLPATCAREDSPAELHEDGGGLHAVGCASHTRLAQRAARESSVLLLNRPLEALGGHPVLPLSAGARVAVGGPAAEDVGRLCGGWTRTWQGVQGKEARAMLGGGRCIWTALRSRLGADARRMQDAVELAVPSEKGSAAAGGVCVWDDDVELRGGARRGPQAPRDMPRGASASAAGAADARVQAGLLPWPSSAVAAEDSHSRPLARAPEAAPATAGGAGERSHGAHRGVEGEEVAVLCLGETPYAEWLGDVESLAMSKEDEGRVRACHAARPGRPIVVVLITGRPLSISPGVMDLIHALLVPWLPGTRGGEAVADLLLGATREGQACNPDGRLSFPWPQAPPPPSSPAAAAADSAAVAPAVEDAAAGLGPQPVPPLFPVGFGLTFTHGSTQSRS